MSVFISIILFLVVLFVLILVHEWGHYFAAKRTGMRVDEFGIGFPPKLFGIKRGETEYVINALPIGGYVKIFGEDATSTIGEGDGSRAFSARPQWAQAIVLIAGVVMNTVFAWFLFVVMLVVGISGAIDESMYSPDTSKLIVTGVLPGLPADGLIPTNAVITSVETAGEKLSPVTPSAFSDLMAKNENQPITIRYTSNNEQLTANVTPLSNVLPESPDRPAIGVSLVLVDTIQYSFGGALIEATMQTWSSLKAITLGLGGLFGGIFSGTADFSQVTGPIGIVGYVGDAASNGFTSLLYFTAIISLNLAVINLLPIPALDGGRLVFVAIEAVIRKPIHPVWASRVNIAGFAALMLLMLVVTVNDVLRLW